MRLDPGQLRRLEESYWQLAARGEEFADRFYALLFSRYPQLRGLFPKELGPHKQHFVAQLNELMRRIRRPQAFRTALFELGRRHRHFDLQPAHYAQFCDALLEIMEKMGGREWTAELTDDWIVLLRMISDTMREGQQAHTDDGARRGG